MRKFILGTDFWTDCDDCVALRLLTRAVKAGEISLRGVAINACMEHSVASLVGFLRADGIGSIPIGLDARATDFGGNPPYQKRLAARFAPDLSNTDAEDALSLYRRLLAESEDGEIELIEIGYPQVLAALLASEGDAYSPLDGCALVKAKVKRIWMMAGKWDKDGEKENNFCRAERSRIGGDAFCRLCPVPVTFLGWEVGIGVLTGGHLDKNDHLYDALLDHGSEMGRHSWDPMLVHLALTGDATAAGYTTVRGWASVDAITGANHFTPDPEGMHAYVVKAKEDAFYVCAIDSLLSL